MTNEFIVLFIGLEFVLGLIVIAKVIIRYCQMKEVETKLQREMVQFALDVNQRSDELDGMKSRIEYSESVMAYIRQTVADLSVIEFRSFLDAHVLKKVTRSQVTHVVEDIAKKVQENIQLENIDFSETIMSEEFFMQCIVHFSVNNVKKLLDDAIASYDAEEGDEQNG